MENRDKFEGLLERLRAKKATMVLCKLFVFRGNGPESARCSVM